MKRIAVLTSGGDAPGMNPTIRAVVRTAVYEGLEIVGIRRGYAGLIHKEFFKMDVASVGEIINKGGTMLLTARSEEFYEEEYQKMAADNLRQEGIEGLVVIGGEGSFKGALALEKQGIKVVGIPGTIDNDIALTDFTIGFDTAVNTALDGINKLRDTATSHERVFLVEVMGRNSGEIALATGIAGGAEVILIPEVKVDYEGIIESLNKGKERGKLSNIIVIAEGAASSVEVGKILEERTGISTRVVILGHLQRGGSPTVRDCILASRMGYSSVQFLLENRSGVMTAINNEIIVPADLITALSKKKRIDLMLYNLAKVLAI